MFDNLPLWPERASSMAGQVDAIYIFLLVVCGMVALLVFTCLLYFAARYRSRAGVEAEQIEGSTPRFHGVFLLGSDRLLQAAHASARRHGSLRCRQAMDVETGTRRRPA